MDMTKRAEMLYNKPFETAHKSVEQSGDSLKEPTDERVLVGIFEFC